MILRRSLPLFCLTLLTLGAQDKLLPLADEAAQEEEEKGNNDVRDRIPAGAVLTDFSIPRFNEEKRRVSLLRAKKMVVESAEVLTGHEIKLWLFDKNEAIRTIATIAEAEYLIDKERLIGSGDIIIREQNDQFYARSLGGIFNLKTGQALMLGPAQTMFVVPNDKRTTMNITPILPFAAALQMLIASPPPEISAEELANFERVVAPRLTPQFNGPIYMERAEARNADIAKHLAEYLTSIGKHDLLLQVAAPPIADPIDPLEELFKPNPDRIFISSTKGIYFDGANFELVYLGNITLEGMGMKLTCNQDLKVIFDPPVEKEPKADEKKDDALGGFGGVGELKQFTASGNLRISGEQKGQKFYLSGDRAVYDQANSRITVRGDLLGFRLGDYGFRSNSKDAYAVITIKDKQTDVQMSRGNWVSVFVDPNAKKK